MKVMNLACDIYEFLPLTRKRASLKRIMEAQNPRLHFVLDLEDSASDIFSEARNDELKLMAREGLLWIMESLRAAQLSSKIVLRLNPVSSNQHRYDLEALRGLPKGQQKLEIFLAKAESVDELKKAREGLTMALGYNPVIHPIIETVKAKGEAEDLCLACDSGNPPGHRLQLVYGAFDYFLDSGVWPFPLPDSSEYWEVASSFMEICRRNDYTYQHPASPRLTESKELRQILSKIHQSGGTHNAICSLAASQTDMIQSLQRVECSVPLTLAPRRNECIKQMSLEVVEVFENNRSNNRSFSTKDGAFVPPHYYLAAKKWLSQNADD